MLLLDTSVLIDLPTLDLPEDVYAISAVSYAELAFGVELAPTLADQVTRRRRFRELNELGLDWLPFDVPAAQGYASLAAKVQRHRPVHARSKDIMLAGQAYSLGAGLATLNPHDFSLVSEHVPIVVPGRV